MTITKEQAQSDLEKIMSRFGTAGSGTEYDRAAQLVLQTIGVLERRLSNKPAIKMLYLENEEAKKLLPQTVYETAINYLDGRINEQSAREILEDAHQQYELVFKELGISLQ